MTKEFPQKAMGRTDLLAKMESYREKDTHWQTGRAFCLVYHPGDERADLIKEAYNLFFSENALNPSAFPSLRKFESEVVAMCCDLFNGGENAAGCLTSGGTESILLTINTAREWARKNHPEIKVPEVVIPESAHPAFQKAFHYFDIKFVPVPVGPDYRVDIEKVKAALSPNTILLVGSAPSYPHGVMDPITELAQIALEKGILFHVDACIGGFMLPFAEKLGYKIPPFDFRLPGVTSISADLHKYAYAAKGASVIIYKDAELRKFQFYAYTKWSGGIYASTTMLGTRPGGAIAAAWAALMSIGEEGYLVMAKSTLEATEKIKNFIRNHVDLKLVAEPDMTLVAFTAEKLDIYTIGDELNLRGWHFDRQQKPPCLHLTISQVHAGVVDEFLIDLDDSVKKLKGFNLDKYAAKVQLSAFKSLRRLLPAGVMNRLQAAFSSKSSAVVENKRSAAMYGMMGVLSGTGELKDMVIDMLDRMFSLES